MYTIRASARTLSRIVGAEVLIVAGAIFLMLGMLVATRAG
jgi:hypothetical protein